MTQVPKVIAFLILLVITEDSWAQSKRSQRMLEKIVANAAEPIKVITPANYNQAEKLANEALAELLAGNVKQGEILIGESLQLYPTIAIFNYAQAQAALPDVSGANLLMDKAIERVEDFQQEELFVLEPFASTMKDGKMIATAKRYAKQRAFFLFIMRACEVSKVVGERKWIVRNLEKVSLPDIKENKNSTVGFDTEYIFQLVFKIELAMMKNQFSEALNLIDEIPQGNELYEEIKGSSKLSVYLAKQDFKQALDAVTSMYKARPGYKEVYHSFLFSINARMGNVDEAMRNYNGFSSTAKEGTGAYFTLGLIDLQKKDYESALSHFNQSIKLRGNKGVDVYMLIPTWDTYTGLADAYAGLKLYDKARDAYQIALLYYPEHQPAIDGLSKLEVNYVNEAASDKTPPTITITEPFANRGLKVAVAKENVMVRGVAKDQSGIREVSVNGQKIYSQQGGDFWGEINLKAGLNRIEIIAIDMAGNKAFETIQVEKSSIAFAQADPIPVVEKEGKNYALFVAAQNYTDSAIPSLENPVADAVKLKLILKNNYNFADANLISLFNPESDGLRRQLLELTNLLQPEDKLVIFYAGHGIWVDKEKRGYWLLTDAKRNDSNTWLPNKDVLDLIAKIPARHTLLITDACFSGSVFKTRGLGAGAPLALQEMDNKISRVAITSGNDTEVPDESVFMKYLVKALSENKEKYLSAQKMFINQIIEAVMTETKTEPRYGTLELAGHVGGDFVFSKK